MLFVYESTPDTTQNFISWIALKIKTFFYWIWNSLLDIIKRIIKAVIGELDNNPVYKPDIPQINPDKDKYGDINNPGYLQWLGNKLDEYKYYLIISSVVIIGGTVIYLYWDSISGCWRTRPDDPDTSGDLSDYNPTAPDRPRFYPSTSSDSSNSLSEFFRKSIPDKLLRYRNKVKNFFVAKKPPILENIPRGIYLENGRNMYNGLPLPRIETLSDGTEYYFSRDRDGLIKVFSNKLEDTNTISILNSFTNKAMITEDISINERISIINSARSNAIYIAPENSYARNPIFEYIDTDFSKPDFSSTSAASSSNLPGDIDDFEDIPLGPKDIGSIISRALKGKEKENIIPEDINPEAGAFRSGSTTPTQPVFTGDITNPFE